MQLDFWQLHGTQEMMRETRTASARSTAKAKDVFGFAVTVRMKDSCSLAAFDSAAAPEEQDRVALAFRGIGLTSQAPASIGWVNLTVKLLVFLRKTQRFELNIRSNLRNRILVANHQILSALLLVINFKPPYIAIKIVLSPFLKLSKF